MEINVSEANSFLRAFSGKIGKTTLKRVVGEI
jgi:hypothetical protein